MNYNLVGGDCFYDHVQDCQHHRANESCTKARYIKAGNNCARYLEHDRVDHQEEQAKGENSERQGYELNSNPSVAFSSPITSTAIRAAGKLRT